MVSDGSAWVMVRRIDAGGGSTPKSLFVGFIFHSPEKSGFAGACPPAAIANARIGRVAVTRASSRPGVAPAPRLCLRRRRRAIVRLLQHVDVAEHEELSGDGIEKVRQHAADHQITALGWETALSHARSCSGTGGVLPGGSGAYAGI